MASGGRTEDRKSPNTKNREQFERLLIEREADTMGDRPPISDSEEMIPEEEDLVAIPIDGTLDLHTFSPKELPGLLDDYLEACLEKEILDVKIIHGKGKGILRDRVRSILKRHPLVAGFEQAPPEAGHWGVTLVRLRKPETDNPT
jgi:DNA-nicking Smr family endonuclease